MNNKRLTLRKAEKDDILLIRKLIKDMAFYEKRPQDMTGTPEQLSYWLFERKIATVLIAGYEGDVAGYALYYPIFGSFAAAGKVHLEDLFIKEELRGRGLGRQLLAGTAEAVLAEGYTGMEWSCLDWNKPSIGFYRRLGAGQETGREYFEFRESDLEALAASVSEK